MLRDLLRHRLMPKLRKLRHKYSENAKISYAQCGEDLILQHLFLALGVANVEYLDIGAHHPTHLSNTYLFYKGGGRGVCVEPDPSLFEEFVKRRPRDINLNCGVGIDSGDAEFFLMSSSTLNTFSRAEAERYQSYGKQRILKTIRVPLKSVNEILETNCKSCPNLVSLDVEGMEYPILLDFDFRRFRPEVFCLETLTYTEDRSETKLTDIIDLMHSNGYLTYADTYINTIFVDGAAWKGRR
jgi:FkbM family methyltransferase